MRCLSTIFPAAQTAQLGVFSILHRDFETTTAYYNPKTGHSFLSNWFLFCFQFQIAIFSTWLITEEEKMPDLKCSQFTGQLNRKRKLDFESADRESKNCA